MKYSIERMVNLNRFFKHTLFVLALLMPLGDAFNQDSRHVSHFKSHPNGQSLAPMNGHGVYLMKGDSIVDIIVDNRSEEARFIVQFDAPPLVTLKTRGQVPLPGAKEALRTRIRAEQDSFLSDLEKIERTLEIEAAAPYTRDARLRFTYETVFNGVALEAKQMVANEILSLPYVRHVHNDEEVYALIDQSVPVIGADEIWANYDITGEGIVVGILDTGIDYMHPDLGGGLGPDHKVMGGYDFVNDNNDPMDDHSHGTHVAGIVAANGVLKGVAPDARLVGYKVLDAGGSGYASWIIAGIEQSVIDGVDVLNVSLGGPGSPDDPMSQAIDNASVAGVVCVVAAGNSGPSYWTIGSPGVAKNALTVGATHLNDDIAEFSSKGPVANYYDIKPDLMAPGVQTNAPVLNGEYAHYSGTSMSAPHVAGAAALLLAQYPDLTPEQVKGVFSQSAIDIGLNIWSQGSGRIDLPNAFILPDILVNPAKLSFGLADLQDDYWTTSETLYVSNIKETSQWVDLSMNTGFPEGAEVSITPSEFALQPDETVQVVIILTVNNQMVPFADTAVPSYSALLTVDAGDYETTIPMAFIKSPVLHISLDEEPQYAFIFSQSNVYLKYSQEFFIPVPEGYYDIFIQYKDYKTILIFEDEFVDGLHKMNLSKQDAKNHVNIIAPDITGHPIHPKNASERFIFPGTNKALQLFEFREDRYFSDFNTTVWRWGAFNYSEKSDTMHIIGGTLYECLSDIAISYEPEELRNIQLDYQNAAPEHDLFSIGVLALTWIGSSYDSYAPPLTHPFNQDLFFSPNFQPGPEHFAFYVESYEHTGYPVDLQHTNPLYKTGRFSFTHQGEPTLSSFDRVPVGLPSTNIIPLRGNVIRMDLGPPLWNGKFYHQEGSRLLMTNLSDLFQLQMKGTYKADQLQYTLYRNGDLHSSGDFYDAYPCFGEMFAHIDMDPGEYVMEITYDHFAIQGVEGMATARMGFNTSTDNGFIPHLSAFNVLFQDGYYTDFIGIGEQGVINFVAEVDPTLLEGAQILLEYRAESDTEWHSMDYIEEDGRQIADIPLTLTPGFTSLRITAVDASGSFLEYTVDPAFLLAETSPAVVQINNGVLDIYQNSALINSEVTEDGGSAVTDRGIVWGTSEYPDLNDHLGVTSDGEGMGRFKSHISELESNTTYYARAYAINSPGVAYSDPFILDQIPDCLPPNALYAESVTQTSASIGWNEAGDAQLWDIVCGYEGFDPDAEGYMVSASYKPYQLEDLQHSAVYDFYVRSHCNDVTSEWSEPGSFTTECGPPLFVFETPEAGEIINITTEQTFPYSYYFFGCDGVFAMLYIGDDNQQHYIEGLSVSTTGLYEDVFEAFETLPGGTYRLRLRYTYDGVQHTLKSNEFEIVNDGTVIELTRPNAGNYFVSGSTGRIRWNALNIPFVNIDYSLDLGQSWSPADHNLPSSDGYSNNGNNQFDWHIPSHIEGIHPGSLVRIESTDDPDLVSMSDPFTISDNLPVAIIAPTAESQIEINEDMEIIIEVFNPSQIHVYLGDQAGFVDHIASFDAETETVATLAELRNLPDDGTIYHYTGEAVIVAMDDWRNRKFLQDETAAIMIDDHPAVITTDYDLYDVITDVAGQISTINNMVQFQPTQDTGEAIDNTPADPVVFALDAVTPDDQAKLIRFNGVQFVGINADELFENGTSYTITDGDNEFVVRTDFWNADYIGETIPHIMVDIAGVVLQYQETLQLVPRFADDIREANDGPFAVTFHLDLSLATEPANMNTCPNPVRSTLNVEDDATISEIPMIDMPGQVVSVSYNTSGLIIGKEYNVYVLHENSGMEIAGEFFTISDVLYELSLTSEPLHGGVTTGEGFYVENEEATVTAIPSQGYQFTHWTGDIGHIDNPSSPVATVIMPPMDIILTANFQIITHVVINASAGEGGSIEPEGAVSLDYGASKTFTITNDTGFLTDALFVDGVSVGVHETYSFTDVTQDHTIHATFTPKTYTLEYTAGENGTLSGETSQVVEHGNDGTPVEAVPDEGHHFTAWSDGNPASPRTDVNVTDDLEVTALFDINVYAITAEPNHEDHGSVTGAGDYQHFEDVTLAAIPQTGYHFVNWTEDSEVVIDGGEPAGEIYTFMAEENRHLVANFLLTTYTVSFQVVDANTDEEIHDATITLDGIQYDAGIYVFEGLLPDTYSYAANRKGYFEASGEVDIKDEDANMVVKLVTDDTSLEETEDPVINVYPNPARTIIHIESDRLIVEIRLIDMLGQTVLVTAVDDTYHNVNIAAMNDGMYFIQVLTDRGVNTLKIQIAKQQQ